MKLSLIGKSKKHIRYENKFLFNLILLFCLVNYQRVEAQEPFEAGISVGALSTQVDGDGYGGYNKSGIQAGVWVSRKFSDNFSFIIEMTYRPKGSKSTFKARIEDLDYYKLALHYIDLPITLQYKNKHYLFDFSLGAAYLAKESEEGYYGGSIARSESPGFNKFDIITGVGLGIQINENWSAIARFTYTVIDAAKNYRSPIRPEFNLQFNNALSVALYRKIGR